MENVSCLIIFVKVNPHFLLVNNKVCEEKSHINLTVSAVTSSPANKKTPEVMNAFPQSFMLGILIKISEHEPFCLNL